MSPYWPLSRKLLIEILADRITDKFVSSLIWERLGYEISSANLEKFVAGPDTPQKAW